MPQASPKAIEPPSALIRTVDLINSGIYLSQRAHAEMQRDPTAAAALLHHSASRMIAAADRLRAPAVEVVPCSH